MKVTYLERSPGSWRLRIETRDGAGKRAFAYETVKGVEEDAQKRRFELLREHEEGTWARPEKMLFSAYLDRWLEQRLALGVIGRSTKEMQARNLATYVKPALGGVRLQAITGSHVQNLYTDLLTKPAAKRARLKNSFVRLLHRVLVTAFRDARKAKLIKVNPMEEVTPPEPGRKSAPKAITAEAAVKVVEGLAGHWLHDPVVTGLGAGLRRGEVCGLRLKDLALEVGKLRVRGQLVQYEDGTLEWKETKSEAGERTIALPPELVELLRARRRAIMELWMRAGLGSTGLEDAWVFSRDGLEPIEPEHLTHAFSNWCDAHGLPEFTFHGTRHTHATHMLKVVGKEGAKAVSQRLGHAGVQITLDIYQTVFESDDRELGDLASGLFGGAKK